ncbi:MAG: hypothetical protein Aurels2KO_00120 [Aureliella sp.]
MLIAFYVLLGVLLLLALFFTLLHPLLCIVDCALSKDHGITAKIAWIVATLFLGFIAAISYTFAGTKSPWLRKSTRNAFGLGVLCAVMALGLSFASPEVQALVSDAGGIATAAAQSDATQGVRNIDQGDAFEEAQASMSALDTQLESFRQQVEQLTEHDNAASDLAVDSEAEIERVPAGQAISTPRDFRSGDPEQTLGDIVGNISVKEAAESIGDLLGEVELTVVSEEPGAVASETVAALGSAQSILDTPIAQLTPESETDSDNNVSFEETFDTELSSEGELLEELVPEAPQQPNETETAMHSVADSGKNANSSEPKVVANSDFVPPASPESVSAERPATPAPPTRPSAVKPVQASRPALLPPPAPAGAPHRQSGVSEQAKPAIPPVSKKLRPFNRYRGTSEPLNLDFPTPPVRNRYINP